MVLAHPHDDKQSHPVATCGAVSLAGACVCVCVCSAKSRMFKNVQEEVPHMLTRHTQSSCRIGDS
jgi:hypothetical protein